ncbi:hypothetical protein TRVL_01158 [Trypanosoma vivax]|nr:hypothetical protein TRVL_01158 [Trypanosoma vivax]
MVSRPQSRRTQRAYGKGSADHVVGADLEDKRGEDDEVTSTAGDEFQSALPADVYRGDGPMSTSAGPVIPQPRKRQRIETTAGTTLVNEGSVVEGAALLEPERRENANVGADEDQDGQYIRQTVTYSRNSGSYVSLRERSFGSTIGHEGFFHDLKTLRPLRVQLGVCPLPGGADTASRTTAPFLLTPRKYLTLPEDKGGLDVVGWACVASGVSIELPSEGIYNKASTSITVVLPP